MQDKLYRDTGGIVGKAVRLAQQSTFLAEASKTLSNTSPADGVKIAFTLDAIADYKAQVDLSYEQVFRVARRKQRAPA